MEAAEVGIQSFKWIECRTWGSDLHCGSVLHLWDDVMCAKLWFWWNNPRHTSIQLWKETVFQLYGSWNFCSIDLLDTTILNHAENVDTCRFNNMRNPPTLLSIFWIWHGNWQEMKLYYCLIQNVKLSMLVGYFLDTQSPSENYYF